MPDFSVHGIVQKTGERTTVRILAASADEARMVAIQERGMSVITVEPMVDLGAGRKVPTVRDRAELGGPAELFVVVAWLGLSAWLILGAAGLLHSKPPVWSEEFLVIVASLVLPITLMAILSLLLHLARNQRPKG